MHKELMLALQDSKKQFASQMMQSQQQVVESQRVQEMKKENGELRDVNKVLSDTVSRQEAKNQELTDKVSVLKPFQRCIKSSLACLCKFCNAYFPTEQFLEHAKSCQRDLGSYSKAQSMQQQRVECLIKDHLVEEDPMDRKTYTVYVINVNFNSESQWQVKQQYRAFCQLHDKLVRQFPSVQFPHSSLFAQKSMADFGLGPASRLSALSVPGSGGGSGPCNMLNDRMSLLQKYLQDLLMIPCIKECNALKEFLQIDRHRPEYFNSGLSLLDRQSQEPNNLFSICVKDFVTSSKKCKDENMPQPYDDAHLSHKQTESLNKFLTGSRSLKQVNNSSHYANMTKTNLRYHQNSKENDLQDSPERPGVAMTEKKKNK